MNLVLNNTQNNTLKISYQTENPKQEIENKIWNEREEYMNKIFSVEDVWDSCACGNDILGKYDKETHHIQHKTDYNMQWKLNQLINELKALTPLYANYTIIYVEYSGMYYDGDKKSTPIWLPSATDPICFDDISYLITEPFTELIRYLDKILELAVFGIYNFTLELLPNKVKSKSKRRKTNVPRGLRNEVFKRDDYTCVQCGATKKNGATLHIDHIIPVSKGGTDELSNLQTLCSDCNLNKSNVIQKVGK